MANSFNTLEVTINEKFGLGRTIKGLTNIKRLVESEQKIWSELDPLPNFANAIVIKLSKILDLISEIENTDGDEKPHITHLKNELENELETGSDWIDSSSQKGQFLLNLAKSDPALALECFNFFQTGPGTRTLQYGKSHTAFTGYVLAAIFDKADLINLPRQRSLDSQITKINRELDAYTNQFSDHFEKVEKWREAEQTAFSTWKDDRIESLEKIVQEKEESFKNLENTYIEKLRLEGPVAYWQQRARKYTVSGWIWIGFLVTAALISMVVFLLIFFNYPTDFQRDKLDLVAVKGLAIVITLISMVGYILHILAKLTLSSFHLVRDAEEREQLTWLYLSLSNEKKMEDKDREIVLQALFSRAETGLLGGDSAPTMPSLGSVTNFWKSTK